MNGMGSMGGMDPQMMQMMAMLRQRGGQGGMPGVGQPAMQGQRGMAGMPEMPGATPPPVANLGLSPGMGMQGQQQFGQGMPQYSAAPPSPLQQQFSAQQQMTQAPQGGWDGKAGFGNALMMYGMKGLI